MKWGNGIGHHSYCRNPDGKEAKPWCFTMNKAGKHAKEPCNIDQCPAKNLKYHDIAKKLAATMGLKKEQCKCADHVYGSSSTTADTSVKFLQHSNMGKTKDGRPCSCGH